MDADLAERRESLWWLAASPSIWAVHFVLSYASAAIFCARLVGADGSLAPVRIAIAIYTLVALVAIGLVGWRGWRRHDFGHSTLPHDFDTPEDRHRFLVFAPFLLSGLRSIAGLFATLVVVFVTTC